MPWRCNDALFADEVTGAMLGISMYSIPSNLNTHSADEV